MANTKIQFKYGQWSQSEAIEMSQVDGVVVYSGKTRGIYVDGKEFLSGEGYERDIDNIEKKNLVASIALDPNKDNNFVSYATESTTDDNGLTTQAVTIGVTYGTFKTGHSDVMDESSTTYTNGISTVEDVQRYIEERLTWSEYSADTDELVANINSKAD